jgi:tetratricopeptide (TPR) repeat protein
MKRFSTHLFFLCFLSGNAQVGNLAYLIDSLKQEIVTAKDDTSRIKSLNVISFWYSKISYEDGLNYAHKAESLSKKINWPRGLGNAYLNSGLNNTRKCDYATATDDYKKALDAFTQAGDRRGQISVYANTALLCMAKSDYANALENNFKALSILEETEDTQMKAIVLENIGTIYLEQKKHPETLKYYGLALENYEKIKDKKGIARNLGNRAIVLNEQGQYEKALDDHLKALQYNKESADLASQQINLANIGITYLNLKKYPLALVFHLQSLNLSRALKDARNLAINMGNTGELYYKMAEDPRLAAKQGANLKMAIAYLDSAIRRCKEINFYGPYIEFAQYLTDAYSLSKNEKLAFETIKEYSKIKDSIFSQEMQLKITALETRRQLDLKDKDITLKERQLQIAELQLVNKKNERTIFLVTIALLCVIILLVYRLFRLSKISHKKVMSDIANIQSHEVRAPVARILGLVRLFDKDVPTAEINKKVIQLLDQAAVQLDEVIKKTVDKTSE